MLPADADEPGPDKLLLLTSGLPALHELPLDTGFDTTLGPLDMLLTLLKAGALARLWYFLAILTKVGGFAITFC